MSLLALELVYSEGLPFRTGDGRKQLVARADQSMYQAKYITDAIRL